MVWVIVAVAGWVAGAVVLGLVIGRAVRVADQRESGGSPAATAHAAPPARARIPCPRKVLTSR